MGFTELNSVEHYIIHQVSGVNLNQDQVSEPPKKPYGAGWQYKSPEQLGRGVNEVMVEAEVKAALLRFNPEISQKPERADEVIYKLRAILISVNQVGLVKANEEFFKWLTGEKTMPFGENNRHVPVRLIDFDDLTQNQYIITNQFRIHHRETKIPDVVLMINGIPVVVGEAKTPIRPSVSWLDGAHEVHNIYENAVPQLFVPNIFSFATEGKELFYGAIRCPLEFWAPWRLENDDEAIAKKVNSAIFPGIQGGPLMHVIAAKAVAFGEALRPEFKTYAKNVIANAQALSDQLIKGGLDTVTHGTDTHVVLVDLRPKGVKGNATEKALGRAHITCNKNGVPFDPEKPTITSGIRLGSPAGTTRGFMEAEFRQIADWIIEVVDGLAANGEDGNAEVEAKVKAEVEALCKRFPLYPNL